MELYKVLKKGWGEHKVGSLFRANYTRQIKAAIDAGILQKVSPDEVLETAANSDAVKLQEQINDLETKLEKLEKDLADSDKAKVEAEDKLKAESKKVEDLEAKLEKLEKKK
jgi:chromosome segregation ATPase